MTPLHLAALSSSRRWPGRWGLGLLLGVWLTALVQAADDPAAEKVAEKVAEDDAEPEAPKPVTPLPRFEVLGDGSEVLDRRAKLVWRRCVQGMKWTGSTCWGFADRMDFQAAQALAIKEGKATGQKWRLPHVPELRLLLVKPEFSEVKTGPDRGKRVPWIDAQWFPATPADWHWTASSTVLGGSVNMYNYGNIMSGTTPTNVARVNPRTGWAFSFATGDPAGDVSKQNALIVRLVRPAP